MSKSNRIYTKHKAFNIAHSEVNKKSETAADFEAPKKYHHDPDKLNDFKDYTGYIVWSNELYSASSRLIDSLRTIYNESTKLESAWYNRKKPLKEIIRSLDIRGKDLKDLYDDIFEFQNCMLATGINQKDAEVNALSDRIHYMSSLEDKITATCNRKLYEISSARVAYAAIVVAILSLGVALWSLLSPTC